MFVLKFDSFQAVGPRDSFIEFGAKIRHNNEKAKHYYKEKPRKRLYECTLYNNPFLINTEARTMWISLGPP